MPRKKRTTCNPRRAQLQFLETPQEGPVHEYGSIPSKADHPICVSPRPLAANSSTTWVSPQFNQSEELHFPARRRMRHTSASTTFQNRTRDHSRSTLRAPARKPSVCKFPSLPFTGKAATETTVTDSVCIIKRPATAAPTKGSITVPDSPPPQDNTSIKVVSPPEVLTPEITVRSIQCTRGEDKSRTVETGELDGLCNGVDSPEVGRARQVLAEDTPEHEYGVRITWRRRQQLMRYLKARGRLKSSQILVKQ
ncbi:RAD9, HUS1, RAD1-interacting nuclear orphan protein 1 isoform 1-T2 [Discoglossus pictus]